MGLPLLGETLEFFAPNSSSDVPPFVKERMKRYDQYYSTNVYSFTSICALMFSFYNILNFLFRYGPVFRTNLVGRPVIVSTNSDLNYYIFQQEGRLFQSWYPDTFTEIFGKQNVGSLHGFIYKYLKGMVLNLFGPESLRKMLTEVEQAANRSLDMWSRQETVELKDATAAVSTGSLLSFH